MCSICGQPGYIRCNCQSAQPFCNPCSENSVCAEIVDSQCVVYHFARSGYTPPPTKLINLNMPNGSSAEAIFERIDMLFGQSSFTPWNPANTTTVDLGFVGMNLPLLLEANVNVSTASGNTLTVKSDGLYVGTDTESGKVKVDVNSPARYLGDAVVGGTAGCVSIDINDDFGVLQVQPFFDIACFADEICSAPGVASGLTACLLADLSPAAVNSIVNSICDNPTAASELLNCLFASGFTAVNTPTLNLLITRVGGSLQLSGHVNISGSSGNIIVAKSDGIYASGGTSSVVTANNGLTDSSNNIQLGGSLLQNTTVDTGAFVFSVSSTKTPVLSAQNFLNSNSDTLIITQGGTLTALNNLWAATLSQIQLNLTSPLVLNSNVQSCFSGSYNFVLAPGNQGVSGNCISGGLFGIGAYGSGTISDAACIRAVGVTTVPGTSGFTGTITNYYGIRIEDSQVSTYATQLTNHYGIYQVGAMDTNDFFGQTNVKGGAVGTASDIRIKKNIIPFNEGLDSIDKINVVKYDFADITNDKGTGIVGVIAQQVEQVLPEAVKVTTPRYGISDFKVVTESALMYTMINAIKELSAQNKTLNARIMSLEGKANS